MTTVFAVLALFAATPAAPPESPPPPPPQWVDPATPPPAVNLQPQQQPERSTFMEGVLVPAHHHLEKKPRGSMYGTGIGLFAGGFVFSVFSALLAAFDYSLSGNGCALYVSRTQWIPLAGPIIATVGQNYATYGGGSACSGRSGLYEFGVLIAVVETILQAGGITLFVLGFALPEKVAVPDDGYSPPPPQQGPPTVSFSIGVPGSVTGLSARLNW